MKDLPCKTVTINGTGIPDTCTVKLSQSDQSDITATDIDYDSEESIICSFDLTNAALGAWDIVVDYFDPVTLNNNQVVLASGVTVFRQRIDSVSPNISPNGSVVAATVEGEGFPWGTVLSLTRQGHSVIIASPTTISSNEKRITGFFDLTGAATGYWNVYTSTGVINTTFTDGFYISTATLISKDIDPYVDSQISIQGPQYGTFLSISSGTFSTPVTITIEIPGINPSINQTELEPLNAYFDITNNKNVQPAIDILMTVTYTNSVAASFNESRFRVCLYDPALGRWSPIPSTSYPNSNRIVSSLNHFSRYGLFQLVPASRLGQVYIYPNPYRPDSNTIYDNPALGRGIVFAGLPPNAKIKIFTMTGELVNEIEETTYDGTLLWDTKNADGHICASGVYLYIVVSQDDPGNKTVGRFAIIE